MKHSLPLFLVATLFLIGQGSAQEQVLLFDGFDQINSTRVPAKAHIRDVREITQTPLFKNAPFLRLRQGDKLVHAVADSFSKGGESEARSNFYLFSGGNYYRMSLTEEDSKLLCAGCYDAVNCLLFDWEVTLEHARALRKLFPYDYADSITVEQYQELSAAVRKQFPELEVKEPHLTKEKLISIPGHTVSEFQGISYNPYLNCVYQYTLRIGSAVCTIHGEVLIKGPDHVDREEFAPVDHLEINGSGPAQEVDPAKAKTKKLEYQKMMRFQKLVERTTSPQRR